MLKQHIAMVLSIGALTGMLRGEDENKKAQPRPLHEQSRNGVTVRLEKITVERVLAKPTNENDKTSQRSVSIHISINGSGKHSGPFKVSFANGYEPKEILLTGKSPPKWKPLFPFKVPSNVKGFERRQFIRNDIKINALFPATVTVHTTTKAGDKLEFIFKNVQF